MSATSGTNGRISINGANIKLNKWTVRSSATKVPTYDFEDSHMKNQAGMKKSEVTMSGFFDVDANPHDVFGIKVGDTLTNVIAYLIKGGLAFTFATFKVFDVEVSNDGDGAPQINISGDCDGSWTYPGAIAS